MNDWTILGIEKTNDLRKVKQAYAEKTKLYHPETHPEEFQKLHNAYKRIVAEIRGGADYQQQIQVPLPLEMNFQKEVHKPVRDTKQDEDFLTLVEEAADNFEARHTDKRDPVQVAKVEYILQHDARNSKLLRQFQWMLYNEFFAKDWRNFFINKEFLERQYEPEFINGMTEILKSRLLEIQRAKKGVYGNIGMLVYFIVVYGAIFEGIDHLQFDKHIYRKESLRGLVDMFPSNADKRDSYRLIEENAELMGERYAFFLYRSILEELDQDIPAKEKIMEVIIEGFQKENISKVYFDLLLYLIASNRKNIPVFKDALAQVCKMEWGGSIQDEIEILKLELTGLQEEGNIEQQTQTTETQRKETFRKEIQRRKIQKKEEEKKFNRVFGKWIIRIAGIILCINVFCRIVDAGKSREYVRVMGTVTKTQTTEHWIGRNRGFDYRVWIDYQPLGYLDTYGVSESYSFGMFSKGDTVLVLYRKDAVYEAYIAKKDWMTGAYLPVSKKYNVPLIIAAVLFVIGLLVYTNSPILEWYTHAGEITIGKKKISQKK